jgi:hypothetical protein
MVKKSKKVVKKKVRKKSSSELDSELKEEKQREGELPSRKIRDMETRQLVGFFVIIGLCFVAFLAVYYGVQSQKNFNYEGAEWWVEGEKEGWGDLTLYHGRYPIETTSGKVVTNMNLWLQNDPRENNVAADVDFINEGIAKNVVISFTADLLECPNRATIVPQLSQALGLPWTTVSGAVADREMAENFNISYVDCANATLDTTVVLIQRGEFSKVYLEDGCYVIQYGECEDSVLASEKLILELIRQLDN